jgi:TolB-like protein/DNA-binding SARP family transcriptional activator
VHELKLFGGATLEADGVPVGGRRHPPALLALLATAPLHTLARGRLVGLLWPDSSERAARNRLNTCLYHARRELGDAPLQSVADQVRLVPEAIRCDVIRFDSALAADEYAEAVALYAGPLLDGFSLPGAVEFEHHIERQRLRHRERYREALEALARGSGDPSRAVGWWRLRVAEDPYDGRVTRALMEALAASGNPAEAIRVGESHERRVHADLDAPGDDTVRSLVQRLRAGAPDAIVTTIDPSATGPAPLEPAALPRLPDPTPVPDVIDDSISGRGRWTWVLPLAAASLVAMAVVLAEGNSPAARLGMERSVAVLPFEGLDSSSSSVMLASAVTEELTPALSEVPELVVKSRGSAARFRDSDLTVAQFARALDVALVIRGRVQSENERVRVFVQLIDGPSGRQVWAQRYESEIGDRVQAQVDVARRVADRLAAPFTRAERDRILARATADSVAYQLFLRAQQEVGLSSAERISLLRASLHRDPAFWPARLSLANFYVHQDRLGGGSGWADSARIAFDLTQEDADSTHVPRIAALRAMAFGGDLEEIVAQLRSAVERHPSDVQLVVALGRAHRERGRMAEAARWEWRAARLDPLTPQRWRALCSPSISGSAYTTRRSRSSTGHAPSIRTTPNSGCSIIGSGSSRTDPKPHWRRWIQRNSGGDRIPTRCADSFTGGRTISKPPQRRSPPSRRTASPSSCRTCPPSSPPPSRRRGIPCGPSRPDDASAAS